MAQVIEALNILYYDADNNKKSLANEYLQTFQQTVSGSCSVGTCVSDLSRVSKMHGRYQTIY